MKKQLRGSPGRPWTSPPPISASSTAGSRNSTRGKTLALWWKWQWHVAPVQPSPSSRRRVSKMVIHAAVQELLNSREGV